MSGFALFFGGFFYYFEIVYIDLVVMLILINLPYVILLRFTLKIFFSQGLARGSSLQVEAKRYIR